MQRLKEAFPGLERIFPTPPPQKTEEQKREEAKERWRLQVVTSVTIFLMNFSDELPFFDNQVDSEQTLRAALEHAGKFSQHVGGIYDMIRVDAVPEKDNYKTAVYGMLNAEQKLVANVWGEIGTRGEIVLKYILYV